MIFLCSPSGIKKCCIWTFFRVEPQCKIDPDSICDVRATSAVICVLRLQSFLQYQYFVFYLYKTFCSTSFSSCWTFMFTSQFLCLHVMVSIWTTLPSFRVLRNILTAKDQRAIKVVYKPRLWNHEEAKVLRYLPRSFCSLIILSQKSEKLFPVGTLLEKECHYY